MTDKRITGELRYYDHKGNAIAAFPIRRCPPDKLAELMIEYHPNVTFFGDGHNGLRRLPSGNYDHRMVFTREPRRQHIGDNAYKEELLAALRDIANRQ